MHCIQQRTVRASEKSRGAGDHFKIVPGRLFSGVVNDQNADSVVIRELFQLADNFVIVRVTVGITADLSDFLQGVHDDEFGVFMLLHEQFKLFVQSIPELFCIGGEVECTNF